MAASCRNNIRRWIRTKPWDFQLADREDSCLRDPLCHWHSRESENEKCLDAVDWTLDNDKVKVRHEKFDTKGSGRSFSRRTIETNHGRTRFNETHHADD